MLDAICRHENRSKRPRLAIHWLGTAGFRLLSGGHHVWIDPHLSRHRPLELLRPIDAPAREIPGNDLAGFVREVRSHRSAPEVRGLPRRGWTQVA